MANLVVYCGLKITNIDTFVLKFGLPNSLDLAIHKTNNKSYVLSCGQNRRFLAQNRPTASLAQEI